MNGPVKHWLRLKWLLRSEGIVRQADIGIVTRFDPAGATAGRVLPPVAGAA